MRALPYYAIARQMWYHAMAGTAVERAPVLPKRGNLAFYALLGAANLAMATEYAVKGWLPCRLSACQSTRSTVPYVAFRKRQHPGPVDYVIGLFNRFDVVVLCERAHPEARQWDFIYDVVRDPRFINRVGHVFTEYGQVGMQA